MSNVVAVDFTNHITWDAVQNDDYWLEGWLDRGNQRKCKGEETLEYIHGWLWAELFLTEQRYRRRYGYGLLVPTD